MIRSQLARHPEQHKTVAVDVLREERAALADSPQVLLTGLRGTLVDEDLDGAALSRVDFLVPIVVSPTVAEVRLATYWLGRPSRSFGSEEAE